MWIANVHQATSDTYSCFSVSNSINLVIPADNAMNWDEGSGHSQLRTMRQSWPNVTRPASGCDLGVPSPVSRRGTL